MTSAGKALVISAVILVPRDDDDPADPAGGIRAALEAACGEYLGHGYRVTTRLATAQERKSLA